MPFEAPIHRLFWAAMPDSPTAEAMAEATRRGRARHGLTGKPLQTGRLHITLYHVGDAVGAPPPELVERQIQRASNVVMPPFRVAFNRAQSFRNGAFVLAGD